MRQPPSQVSFVFGRGATRPLDVEHCRGILPRGGTILGTSRTNPYKIEGGVEKIEANLKETQLTYLRIGQEATIVADAYPDVVYRTKVQSISPATGAEFSLLPPQNASGNWVKVVQRVPVLISLDAAPDGQTPLRAGMTVTARVDTGHVRTLSALR